jgi:AraC-like DNA-binding protein
MNQNETTGRQPLFHGRLVDADRILYTPSEFARENLLFLQEIGTLQAKQEHVSRRKNLNSFLFFMVRSGSGHLDYGSKHYELKEGDCVFLNCQLEYSHETSADLWKLSWVHFDGPFAAGIYEKYLSRGGQNAFHPADPAPFLALHQKLYTEAASTDYIRDMRINEGLTSLLTLLMEQSWNPELQSDRAGKKRDLTAIRSYLNEHYPEKISLDELAAHFFINKYYLVRIFKETYGVPVGQYLLGIRITKAKQLLRFTDRSIEDIGQSCGLGAPYYFSRTFHKVEGISPSEYRRQW